MKILVVDDDEVTTHVASLSLKKGHHAVLCASNGQEALNLAHSQKPDLIVLDVMMPGMDGLSVCKKLKSDPQTASIPVAFLTAGNRIEWVQWAIELGAIGYLVKPFDPRTFSEKVTALMTEASAANSRAVSH